MSDTERSSKERYSEIWERLEHQSQKGLEGGSVLDPKLGPIPLSETRGDKVWRRVADGDLPLMALCCIIALIAWWGRSGLAGFAALVLALAVSKVTALLWPRDSELERLASWPLGILACVWTWMFCLWPLVWWDIGFFPDLRAMAVPLDRHVERFFNSHIAVASIGLSAFVVSLCWWRGRRLYWMDQVRPERWKRWLAASVLILCPLVTGLVIVDSYRWDSRQRFWLEGTTPSGYRLSLSSTTWDGVPRKKIEDKKRMEMLLSFQPIGRQNEAERLFLESYLPFVVENCQERQDVSNRLHELRSLCYRPPLEELDRLVLRTLQEPWVENPGKGFLKVENLKIWSHKIPFSATHFLKRREAKRLLNVWLDLRSQLVDSSEPIAKFDELVEQGRFSSRERQQLKMWRARVYSHRIWPLKAVARTILELRLADLEGKELALNDGQSLRFKLSVTESWFELADKKDPSRVWRVER